MRKMGKKRAASRVIPPFLLLIAFFHIVRLSVYRCPEFEPLVTTSQGEVAIRLELHIDLDQVHDSEELLFLAAKGQKEFQILGVILPIPYCWKNNASFHPVEIINAESPVLLPFQ